MASFCDHAFLRRDGVGWIMVAFLRLDGAGWIMLFSCKSISGLERVAFLDHAFLRQGIAICGILSQKRS
jgi:hypothetical protein